MQTVIGGHVGLHPSTRAMLFDSKFCIAPSVLLIHAFTSALILSICSSSHFILTSLRCLQHIAALHQSLQLLMEDVLHVSDIHVQLIYGLVALPKQLTQQIPSLFQFLHNPK